MTELAAPLSRSAVATSITRSTPRTASFQGAKVHAGCSSGRPVMSVRCSTTSRGPLPVTSAQGAPAPSQSCIEKRPGSVSQRSTSTRPVVSASSPWLASGRSSQGMGKEEAWRVPVTNQSSAGSSVSDLPMPGSDTHSGKD
jgi:hypothetical protein